MNIPKFDIRGNKNIAVAIIMASVLVIGGGAFLGDKLEIKKTAVETDYNNMQLVNLDALKSKKSSLDIKNNELNKVVKEMKEKNITRFDKDTFSTAITTFADLNNMAITKFKQNPENDTGDGFYEISYDISLSGTIYGMMEFMNLIDVMGYQTTIKYFSFRQNGTYEWLERSTDKEELMKWIKEAQPEKGNEELEKIKALAIKIEKDDYDYGDAAVSYTAVEQPSEEIKVNPLQNFIDSLLQTGENIGLKPSNNVPNVITPSEKEELRKKAVEQKEADREKVKAYLEENYPEGTIIKNGQLIIPTLDGSMVFDIGITFTGNKDGKEITDDYMTLLLPVSATTSSDKKISIVWNGVSKKIPSVIEGVDVSALEGINISNSSKFTVSWNNNQLSKEIVEQCLKMKEDRGVAELSRVAAEIRFLQKNGKTDLEIMKYLIFLYQYIYG